MAICEAKSSMKHTTVEKADLIIGGMIFAIGFILIAFVSMQAVIGILLILWGIRVVDRII